MRCVHVRMVRKCPLWDTFALEMNRLFYFTPVISESALVKKKDCITDLFHSGVIPRQQRKVVVVSVDPVALFARGFMQHACVDQGGDGFEGGGLARLQQLAADAGDTVCSGCARH